MQLQKFGEGVDIAMVGSYDFKISSEHISYEFTIKRNITFIEGDSGTGKTTLIELLTQALTSPSDIGVTVETEADWEILDNNIWRQSVHQTWHGKVVFLDEELWCLSTKDFARFVKNSGNYVVIISREPHKSLNMLPHSTQEMYRIRYEDGVNRLEALYPSSRFVPLQKPNVVVTEDENAGFAFFTAVAERSGISCYPGKGKPNIDNVLRENDYFPGREVLVVADGAAFGPQIKFFDNLLELHPNVQLWLPESFEYLILSSPLFRSSREIQEILADPSRKISTDYFSWERFFTWILKREATKQGSWYNKSNLNVCYKRDCCCKDNKCNLYTEGNKIDLILGAYAGIFQTESNANSEPKTNFAKSSLFDWVQSEEK